MSIAELRVRLNQLDADLLQLVAERQAVVARIGAEKRSKGQPLRDFAREKQVLDLGQEKAEAIGLDGSLAREMQELLIRHSLTRQELNQIGASESGAGLRALVIGGSGRMGGWISRFLHTQDFAVTVADPNPTEDGFDHSVDWETLDLDFDVIVVAAPLRPTNQILEKLAARKPGGLIFDVASLKSPLSNGLQALKAAGCRVTSVHPMFGPNITMLSGKHVLFVDVGDEAARDEARALFAPTMADRVNLSLAEHDETMGWVLGLSHLINLGFGAAIAAGGDRLPLLKTLSSTTFDRQLDIATSVAHENPHLYYEIQHFNASGARPVEAFLATLEAFSQAVNTGDESAFVELMLKSRNRLNPATA